MASNESSRRPLRLVAIVLGCIGLLGSTLRVLSEAQVTTNITPTTGAGNLGTIVTPGGATTTITGGTRPGNGTNLFHSFGQFSIAAPDTANFFNETGRSTTNILSRVTGGSPSNIFGTIQTTGFGNANLFLMNPAGIVFGPNATLNVGGSVHFTTADYLRLADQTGGNAGIFHANTSLASVLTTAPVAAFGFLSPNPVAITIDRSVLIASPEQTVSFIGGDFSVLGDPGPAFPFIGGFGSRVNIAAVASPGEVIPNSPGAAPDLIVESFTKLGDISLAEVSLGVSGFNQNVDPGGVIVIRGNDMTFTDNVGLIARGAPGGQINIRGNTLQMLEGSIVSTTTRGSVNHPGDAVNIQLIGNFTLTDGEIASSNVGLGKAGDIRISAANMYFGPDNPNQTFFADFWGDIGSRSFGPGRTGDVEITTPGELLVKNGFFFGTRTLSTGNGGNTTVRAGTLEVRDGSSIDSASLNPPNVISAGNAGILEITADTILLSAKETVIDRSTGLFTQAEGTGAGGLLRITVGELQVLNGATISSTVANGTSQGGAVEINAKNIIVSGTGVGLNQFEQTFIGPARITSSVIGSGPQAMGSGGSLRINTDTLTVTDRGQIISSLFNGSPGSAGVIDITAKSIEISNRGLIAATAVEGTGPAGGVDITANDVRITGVSGTADPLGADLTGLSTSTNAGPGGTLRVTADNLSVTDRGSISSLTIGAGNAGTVDLNIAHALSLSGGGLISTTSSGAGAISVTGNAGNILIRAGDQFVMRDSTVTTQATVADGGNITIRAGEVVQLINSDITTSVGQGLGNGGNITIDPEFVILQNGSRILANAFGGNGGNIKITAGLLLVSPDSDIDASSALGVSGTVTINSAISDLSGSLTPLPQGFLGKGVLLSSRCAARVGGSNSSFVVAGREAVPMEPGGLLPSPLPESSGLAIAGSGSGLLSAIGMSATLEAGVEQGCGS